MRPLLRRLRRFARDTRGSVSVEFILAIPMLIWAFGASVVYLDAYRQSSVNLKAAYTISDLISRETGAVNDTYIDAMLSLLHLLTAAEDPSTLRITIIRWDQDQGRYHVDWSANRGFLFAHDDVTVMAIEDRLPVLPDGERVILVETRYRYDPLFNVGLGVIDLDNFVFARPRFAPQVVWGS
ncbi:TadE/TadG family type IV pilus assembly protein [Pukyongiella litopenaei]|uniref:Pilus assembly protein n=1 Tax=Pukyongiella litopenaei TaxID=2605946 RepID=A0A2S0MK80_9RHOB|nr:hypothetical protein [Pukyongiella litopenaei]AVO36262.1 pilus assembly protein [Pukyongiella litopenaei]